ncbi:MAG: (d)CMP kinase [Verrucomicrobiota bacterium]|nr:(d)CMP kinase [Verrucomicrobiota bacterium]
MIIAIDGPSGTGKSTVAKSVAKQLKFTFFDTGAMYRSFAWWVLKQQIDPHDEEKVKVALTGFEYQIETDPARERRYIVNGIDVSMAIRTQEISTAASIVAKYPDVRQTMVKIQRKYGALENTVFEGRDMGTVVFPQAEVKVFLTAKAEVRAERRYRELLIKFPDLTESLSFEQILKETEERDRNDMTRAISPLKKAPDAILIDTSYLTAQQVIDQIIAQVKLKQKKTSFSMGIFYGVVYWLARLYLKLFYRLKIYGLSHFRSGSAIIAANHASYLDPPVVSISCPEEVHFLAKESLFRVPVLGFLIRHLNSHPVSRDVGDATTFRLIINLLQKGKKIILFPEGNRTADGQLQPIERGLAFLTMKARCRIQPVYISGTFKVWPPGRPFPKFFGRIACVFGSPIEWEEFEGLEKREAEKQITERMKRALYNLKNWYDAGAKGFPP